MGVERISLLERHQMVRCLKSSRRNKKTRFYICSEVIDSITDANSACLGCGLQWFGGGLGLTWQVNV